MLFLPQGANTNTNKVNGIEPNQEIEIFFTKLKFFEPFFKNKPNSCKT